MVKDLLYNTEVCWIHSRNKVKNTEAETQCYKIVLKGGASSILIEKGKEYLLES